uniref:WD and tetratricopeptide repeats protein 1 n=1 Tax=Panagrolaimus sp. PS1159 TaxID=55785 RepID=A0AC35GUW8_9BILA
MREPFPIQPNTSTLRSLFKNCQNGLINPHSLNHNLKGNPTLIKKLQLSDILRSHEGCVNTIEWDSEGRLLVSGSDDRHIAIWNLAGKELTKFPTEHDGNIFAAKFMNNCNNSKIVSGAADGKVFVYQWRGTSTGAAEKIREWKDQSRRVKQVVLNPGNANTFFSCSENGFIIQYDDRADMNSIVQEEQHGVKSIAVNPVNHNYLAAGVAEEGIKLYDIRNTVKAVMTFASAITTTRAESHTSTYIEFNSTGTKLLANCQAEGIYVFDAVPGSEREPRFLERMDKLLKYTFSKDDLDPEHSCLEETPYDEEKHVTREYHMLGNYLKAIEGYSSVIHKIENALLYDPTNAALKGDLAILLQTRADCIAKRDYKSDLMDATRDYIRSMELFPNNYQAHAGIIHALEGMQQYAKAKKWNAAFVERFEYTGETILKHPDKKSLTKPVNIRTDIKQARFLGGNDEFIVAGSDCGHMFIWDSGNGNIVKLLKADNKILNCAAPHPTAPLIASSGIENVIKFWSPFEDCNESTPKLIPEDSDIWQRRDDISNMEEIVAQGQLNQSEPNMIHINNVEIFIRLAQLRNSRPDAFETCRQS